MLCCQTCFARWWCVKMWPETRGWFRVFWHMKWFICLIIVVMHLISKMLTTWHVLKCGLQIWLIAVLWVPGSRVMHLHSEYSSGIRYSVPYICAHKMLSFLYHKFSMHTFFVWMNSYLFCSFELLTAMLLKTWIFFCLEIVYDIIKKHSFC